MIENSYYKKKIQPRRANYISREQKKKKKPSQDGRKTGVRRAFMLVYTSTYAFIVTFLKTITLRKNL